MIKVLEILVLGGIRQHQRCFICGFDCRHYGRLFTDSGERDTNPGHHECFVIVIILLFKPQGIIAARKYGCRGISVGLITATRDFMNRRKNVTQIFIFGVLICLLAFVPLITNSPYNLHIFILTLIYIIAAASLRFINNIGAIPLAHGAFMDWEPMFRRTLQNTLE